MEIAVLPANPAAIAGLADLATPGVKVALCQPRVRWQRRGEVFANAKITVTPVSQEADVKAVLTKVQLGEVDARRRLRHGRQGRRGQGQGHRDRP